MLDIFDPLHETLAQLRSRITNVTLGRVKNGCETFTFELDRIKYECMQKDEMLNYVIGINMSSDIRIAAKSILTGNARRLTK